MTPEEYKSAVEAARDLPDSTYCRVLVNITCLVNRRWLRGLFPEFPISYRAYEAIALPFAAFERDQDLMAKLRQMGAFLVVEAKGRLTVQRLPTN